MISFDNYVRAKSLEEAYELNQSLKNVVGGGLMWLHLSNGNYENFIDLCDLGLDEIREDEQYFYIGSMVSLKQLEDYKPFEEYFGTLFKDCLKHIVGVQFRNGATIGGSICAKLGFSDIITMLLPLDTELDFHNQGKVKLLDYINDKNKRDILKEIIIPKKKRKIKFESIRRTYTDIAIINVCGVKEDDGYYFAVGSRPTLAKYVKEDEIVEFGNNQRGSKEYREKLYAVLKKRIKKSLEG